MATIRSNRLTDKPASEVHESWTEERRSAAIPKPMPALDPNSPASSGEAPSQGPERSEPGQEPATPPRVSKRQLSVEAAAVTIAQPVSDPTAWPYLACGKLFFSQGGTDYVGSAAAIRDNILLTAGHCVYENGNYSQDVEFYPAYPDLDDPWPFREYFVPNYEATYFDGSAHQFDFALLWVPAGMQSDIGHLGWRANVIPTSSSSWNAIGYPSESPFPGDQMYQTTGSCINTGNPMKMDNNDMTPGCSGGPWIMGNQGSNHYANGVNSFRYDNQPTTIYSPQFLQDFIDLLNYIAGNHP